MTLFLYETSTAPSRYPLDHIARLVCIAKIGFENTSEDD